MKKTLRTIGLMLLSAAIGVVLLMGAVVLDWSDRACFATAFAGAILSGLVLGLYDIDDNARTEHMTIRDALRSLRKAA